MIGWYLEPVTGSGLSVNELSRGYICRSWLMEATEEREKPGSSTFQTSRPLPQALREIYDGVFELTMYGKSVLNTMFLASCNRIIDDWQKGYIRENLDFNRAIFHEESLER